jgi:hypothetical protein
MWGTSAQILEKLRLQRVFLLNQPNWLFWECKPTYIAENKTYLTLNDKITIFPYFSSLKIGIICTCSDHNQPLYQI